MEKKPTGRKRRKRLEIRPESPKEVKDAAAEDEKSASDREDFGGMNAGNFRRNMGCG